MCAQPPAQETAQAQVSGAEKVGTAFCPWAALAFCAQHPTQDNFKGRKCDWIDIYSGRVPPTLGFSMCYDKHIVFFFFFKLEIFQGELKLSVVSLEKLCLKKKHCEMFLKNVSILRNYLMNLWTVSLSLKKPICCLKCFYVLQKNPNPKHGGIGERRGSLLTLPSTLALPLRSLAPKGVIGHS